MLVIGGDKWRQVATTGAENGDKWGEVLAGAKTRGDTLHECRP